MSFEDIIMKNLEIKFPEIWADRNTTCVRKKGSSLSILPVYRQVNFRGNWADKIEVVMSLAVSWFHLKGPNNDCASGL